jgi:hypothetical protein
MLSMLGLPGRNCGQADLDPGLRDPSAATFPIARFFALGLVDGLIEEHDKFVIR